MKDPADNRKIDIFNENYLVEVTAQVKLTQATSPCAKWCDRKVGDARNRPDEKKRRSGRLNNSRSA